jgi:hypothetical protein
MMEGAEVYSIENIAWTFSIELEELTEFKLYIIKL